MPHHIDTNVNIDSFLQIEIDTDVILLHLHELFYQIHKFFEHLNLCSQITTKCSKQKCVKYID